MEMHGKEIGGWVVKVLVVALPALCASYFSYRSASVEAVAKVEAAKAQAAAGYEVTVKALERLVLKTEECSRDTAELRGMVTLLSRAEGVVRRERVTGGEAPHADEPMGVGAATGGAGLGAGRGSLGGGRREGASSSGRLPEPSPAMRLPEPPPPPPPESADETMKSLPQTIEEAYKMQQQKAVDF